MLIQVTKFVKKYELLNVSVNSSRLKEIIQKQGYTIVWFKRSNNSHRVQNLIENFNLHESIRKKSSFICSGNDNKYLFIYRGINDEECEILLWHELSHIWQKHIEAHDSEIIQEFNAHRFVIYVQLYIRIMNILKYTSSIASTILLVITLSLSHSRSENCLNTITPPESPSLSPTVSAKSPQPSARSDIPSDIVYITKSSSKFHRADCRYVKNKTDTLPLSIKEALRKKYEPCKVCRPNEQN